MQDGRQYFSITQLNEYVRMLLDGNAVLSDIWIKGEISNFTNHRTGHMYFSVKDAGATEGFIIQYVNDQPVKSPQDVIDIVKKSKRAVFVEGVTPSGRTGYFGFGV